MGAGALATQRPQAKGADVARRSLSAQLIRQRPHSLTREPFMKAAFYTRTGAAREVLNWATCPNP